MRERHDRGLGQQQLIARDELTKCALTGREALLQPGMRREPSLYTRIVRIQEKPRGWVRQRHADGARTALPIQAVGCGGSVAPGGLGSGPATAVAFRGIPDRRRVE